MNKETIMQRSAQTSKMGEYQESKELSAIKGKMILARQFPRDPDYSLQAVLRECARPELAAAAQYEFPRGDSVVRGPSIRLVEVLARWWGNIDYGIKELSQDKGKSEMQAYAWDLETNAQSVQNFTNPHIREVNGKIRTLTSQRDIYENNANMATRRLRSRILAILPAWFVEDAIAECKKTIAGQNDIPLIERVKKMVVQFAKFGVTQEQIETRLKRKVNTMTVEDFTEYLGIYNAIKNGESKVSDWFDHKEETTAQKLTDALKAETEGK